MGIPLANADILQVTYVCKNASQYGQFVRHFRVSVVGAPPATVEDALNSLSGNIAPELKGVLAAGASYVGLKGNRIRPIPSPAFKSLDGAGAGTVVGDSLPSQTSGLVRWLTALGGRANKGRSYIPFPGEADSDANGNPTAGYVTRLGLVAGENDDAVNINILGRTATLIPVIYHRVNGTTTDVITGAAISKWATQRRRSQINRPDADPLDGVPLAV